jgi:hypothetical protein
VRGSKHIEVYFPAKQDETRELLSRGNSKNIDKITDITSRKFIVDQERVPAPTGDAL